MNIHIDEQCNNNVFSKVKENQMRRTLQLA